MPSEIQRDIKADGSPKGTSIIAREYSPGKPQPTLMQVIKENSIDETKESLDFTDAKTEFKESDDIYEQGTRRIIPMKTKDGATQSIQGTVKEDGDDKAVSPRTKSMDR